MEKFIPLEASVAPLDRANVDTDQIIPKQFLRSVSRTGFGPFLFDEWRYADRGELGMNCENRPRIPEFPLNRPECQGAQILLARDNFGCGSSREHAVWALMDAGFRCVVAPSFGDIFRNNACQNGLLPVALPRESIDRLFQIAPPLSSAWTWNPRPSPPRTGANTGFKSPPTSAGACWKDWTTSPSPCSRRN